MTKRYSELLLLPSYNDRLRYLCFEAQVGDRTFGEYRYFNQAFYASVEWRRIRNEVIFRDNGCDLGIPELPIRGKIMIHHLNPVTLDDICHGADCLIDPENLICCSMDTHNKIHFGIFPPEIEYHERSPNDMCPWKK